MSRQNKVNPDHYKVAGRLSMDDLARERRNQSASQMGDLRGRHPKAMPPWMTKGGSARPDERPIDDKAQASEDTPALAAKAKPVTTRARGRKPRSSTTPRTRSIAAKTKTLKATARKTTKTTARNTTKATVRKTARKRTAKSRAR